MSAHKTKTRTVSPEELYELIEETPALAEDERAFWFARYESLDAAGRIELVRDIRTAERELKKEEDHHEQRVAEIIGKCETRLKRLADDNKLEKLSTDEKAAARTGYDPFADDDLLEALKNDSF